jgi:hypothetical protein
MESSKTNITLSAIPTPTPWSDANRRLLLGNGAPIDPIVRLTTFTDAEFERFIWEWARGYLADNYVEVQHRGGAGDKGRDIVAWRDPSSTAPRRWDLYQCKRYKDPLTPSEFLVELGKLCFYTLRKDYTVPGQYWIVGTREVGNALQDLIDEPLKLQKRIIEEWDKRCRDNITAKHPVPLEGALRAYVETFDFSIVKTLAPQILIEQHSHTKEHLAVFGSQFKPRRPVDTPPADVAPKETIYVASMYEAFGEHLKTAVLAPGHFAQHDHLTNCFNYARECFYCAESLKEFSRDNLPNDKIFNNLCSQVLQGITPTLIKVHKDGYEKLIEVTEKVVQTQITSNILTNEMEPNDRVGLCHQLANEGRVRWVKS